MTPENPHAKIHAQAFAYKCFIFVKKEEFKSTSSMTHEPQYFGHKIEEIIKTLNEYSIGFANIKNFIFPGLRKLDIQNF